MPRSARPNAVEQEGFTLIEILVVILMIGILAAIAIPSFLNQRGTATDAKYKSAARTAQTAMQTYFTDKNTYVGATASALYGLEATLNDPSSFRLTVPTAAAKNYQVKVANRTNSNDWYVITRAPGGAVTRTCGTGAKSCNGGTW